MSLRWQLNLIVTGLLGLFASSLIGLQLGDTRRSVHEEVVGAHVVASQMLARMDFVYVQGGMEGMAAFLARIGRIRANELALYDAQGRLLYRSPPSRYKEGREAPQWYARIVSPPLQPTEIALPRGRIVLRPDASRATLDGWDNLQPMLWLVLAGFAVGNLLVYALVDRAMRPMRAVVQALGRVARGDYGTRLAAMPGREGQQIGEAFNSMAQSVQDSAQARRDAQQAGLALAQSRELTQVIQARIEQERGAIARELHDELGQQVTAIKSVGLAMARRAAGRDEAAEQSARLVMDCADRIYDGVHRLIGRLRPLALDRFGLDDALQDLVAEWRLQHPAVELGWTLEGRLDGLDDALSTAVYRLVQEAVNNALRHAQARRIDITVRAGRQTLQVEVADNGSGRLDDFELSGHYGVLGMRERVEGLGGRFALVQLEPSGIRVTAVLPRGGESEGGAIEADAGR